jgi:hypothetical protein
MLTEEQKMELVCKMEILRDNSIKRLHKSIPNLPADLAKWYMFGAASYEMDLCEALGLGEPEYERIKRKLTEPITIER